jgi:DNA-directed RNA polymerase subunit RPC12/RpoP
VKEKQEAKVRYRCEDCGAIIEWDGPRNEQG